MGLWDNVKSFMNIDSNDFEDDAVEETRADSDEIYSSAERKREPRLFQSERKSKNAGAASAQMQVVIVKPDHFEDVTMIADHLNAKKSVVLNLEASNRETSRRILDFLSGVAYANGGTIRKVANSTFMITPGDVDIMGEFFMDEYSD